MSPDAQLELFQIPRQAPGRYGVASIGAFQIRQDHAVLVGIISLIGLTVAFALGVERGKQFARSERLLLEPQGLTARVEQGQPHVSSHEGIKPADSSGSLTDSSAPKATSAPTRGNQAVPRPNVTPKAPAKAIAGRSRFAIQVVTYSQPKLAHRELQRLTQRGERAFLVMKQGRVVLFVGPFLTKKNASTKLVGLKQRYQDCFIRTL